jgi:hypothetical protein
MWFVIVIMVLLLLLWANSKTQASAGDVQSRYFGPDSMAKFKELQGSGLSTDSLKEFIAMEDQFLAYEKESVCNKVSRTANATAISQQIKDRFAAHSFSYHDDHIRQMTTPDRLINKNLKCF